MKTTKLAETATLNGAREDVLVYDYETTGTSTAHDQVLQFGAVRATADLEPVVTYEEHIRRLPYVIPHPSAIKVTHVDIDTLDSPQRPTEFEAAGEIASVLTPPPGVNRTVVFFNGLRFDREMSRSMFFRNLLDPYEHERGVRFIDTFNLVRLAEAMTPGQLVIPVRDDGTKGFRLSEICEANGISLDAHDGVEDALGTLALTRLIRDSAPEAYAVGYRSGRKSTIETHLSKACEESHPVWLFTHFSKADAAPYLILKRMGKGDWLGVDLRHPTGDIREALLDIDETLYDPKSPLRAIKPNRFPYFLSAAEAASFEPSRESDDVWLDAERAIHKAKSIRSGLGDMAIAEPSPYKSDISDPTSEERIYSGFLSNGDRRLMAMFRRMVDWKARTEIRFEDERIRDFAARILMMTSTEKEDATYPNLIAALEKQCQEAATRPARVGNGRWTSIEEARIEGDKVYRNWLKRFDDPAPAPAPEKPVVQEPARYQKPEQLGFAF